MLLITWKTSRITQNETSDDKAQKLARAFAKDMQNPDIIGVTEVQDNNGAKAGDSAANESYERLIAKLKKQVASNMNM